MGAKIALSFDQGAHLNFGSLIEDIYEAGVFPEKWQIVLDRLAEIAEAKGTLLFAASPGEPRWLCSPSIYEVMHTWTHSRWFLDNPRGRYLVPIREPRFLTDFDALTAEQVEASDFYTDLLRPHGIGWCVGTTIRSPSGDALVFSVEKAHEKGPVPREVAETLDSLRPHLARAALLSGRLGLERAKATVTTLEMIGLPAAALNQTGRVVHANASFFSYAPRLQVGANDILKFANQHAQKLLTEALSSPVRHRMGKSIPIAGTKREPPFVAHVLPLFGGGFDLFTGAMSVLYITPVIPNSGPAPELLQALFDLTPAESRVTQLILEGKSVDLIATATGNSHNTIRTHLKSVFLKTGVQRQTELVRLLCGTFRQERSS